LQADAGDVAGLARAIKGRDAVISSVHFTASDPHKLIAAVRQAGVPPYLVVGGAGSLEVAPGVKLIDTPQFPAIYKAQAAAGGVFLDLLRQETALDWTFPPRRCSCPASAPGSFASAATSCWPTTRAAASRSRIMPSRWLMKSKSLLIRANALPLDIEASPVKSSSS
jgi:putative NADH-flavin reductase